MVYERLLSILVTKLAHVVGKSLRANKGVNGLSPFHSNRKMAEGDRLLYLQTQKRYVMKKGSSELNAV